MHEYIFEKKKQNFADNHEFISLLPEIFYLLKQKKHKSKLINGVDVKTVGSDERTWTEADGFSVKCNYCNTSSNCFPI